MNDVTGVSCAALPVTGLLTSRDSFLRETMRRNQSAEGNEEDNRDCCHSHDADHQRASGEHRAHCRDERQSDQKSSEHHLCSSHHREDFIIQPHTSRTRTRQLGHAMKIVYGVPRSLVI